MTLLSIEHLNSHFMTVDGIVRAVDDVSLEIGENETLGLVGESGCGKTVLALSLLRLLSENTKTDGKVIYKGRDLLKLNEKELRGVRGKEIAHIFQNPLSSLNPVLTVGFQISEPFLRHQGLKKSIANSRAVQMLGLVRIPSAPDRAKEYPHEFSGGMRQRAMIAMGLACSPSLIIADEPTRGLDVTIQAQIVELMKDLIKNSGASMLLITHDLSLAAQLCDKVAVMYSGEIVEYADIKEFFKGPAHPYARSFLESVPSRGMKPIRGISPSLINPPPGCRFHPRCDCSMDMCKSVHPPLTEVKDGQHARCLLYA
ncbi:MAG: ABC transporter ATP-binding protein [Methanothrix sp.]|jgi:peptide/nickel transport system ATP-binding protein|uniref:ABC transporter ATP-binding protein n=1 Tax=Methanothrix sp. TaxID=90426 RepID=UPI0025E04CDA|nr:ABC transporter ATP-binding protein [Methanothrix sp.]MCK9406734.1 ABC transporter ATP-binding protein [Methanothrix sp.]